MASSLVEFLFALLFFCAVGWVVLVFAARLLAWFLSRVMGASIGFQVAGCNCLRDVTVQFRKGTVESLSVGEIKLGLRKSLIKSGFSFVSREPKLQLLLCDLEIVIRPSEKSIQKSKPQRSHSAGGGRWMVLANMGRFLSVTVTELVIKIPKAGIEVKDLTVDISKNGGSNPILNVKLHLTSFLAQICDSQLNNDPSTRFSEGDFLLTRQSCSATIEKNRAPFICEDFLVSCEFDHNREQGIKIRDLDMTSGDITINLNENMFLKTKPKSESLIGADSSESSTKAKRSQKDSHPMKKHILMFPEKVSFNMPKLNVTFMHRGEDLFIQNNVMGIHLRSSKSQAYEDSGIITSHFDIQLDFSEIHLLREGATSIMGILKVAVIASVDVPMQPSLPIRTEIDLKLGGTQCNLIMSRLTPWIRLQLSQKKKRVLREENCNQESSQASNTKAIMWTCTCSAPEMNIVLYSLNDLPLYNGFSQSSHLFANNIESKGIQVHAELGELHLHMAEANQDCSKENFFDVEINSGSLMQVARVSLDWGHREMESHEGHDLNRLKLVLAIDITGVGVFFGIHHVESLILTIMSFKALLKSLFGSGRRATQNKVGRSGKTTVKGTHILKLNLDKCSINYYGDMSVEDMVVADPKRVNFGSQGGEVLISVSADGTPRRASITSTISSDCKHLKFSTSLNIAQLRCLKEKHSMKIELERAKSIYQEYFEDRPGEKVALFDMQKAKFVRCSGGHNDIVCSLFNVTDVAVRWEPDVHLALFDFITRLRSLLYKMKNQDSDTEMKDECLTEKDMVPEKEVILDQVDSEKQHRKRESVFAIDLETLKVSAELADGVEAMIHVQSIFSENAKIGVLLEGLILSFNEARFFKSTRMQISRIPISMSCNLLDGKVQPATAWDWVIQGPDVHICMPYRLQLRAIDDAVEDTLRGLKLITRAKTDLIYPVKKDTTKKPNTRSTKLGSVRIIIRKLTADIEEEPIQGWLDEHYKLMKNEVREVAVRLKFFDDVFSAGSRIFESAEPNDLCSERKIHHNGVDIDAHDATSIQSLREEIHKLAFRSYYEACQKMAFSDGSGACKKGFQAGFRPSTVRDSLLSLCATDLDVTLTKIEGSDAGMVDFIKKLDPICVDNEIPFSRMYGSDFVLNAGSLVIQLRDFTFPLFSATSGKCQGCIVLAQQATCFQPQIQQDVYIGRWWRVCMLRSASGTTPPMKMYSDMPICFQKVEVSFGVGYEPTFADISYAFTVALRRANLGNRSCTLNTKYVNAVDSVQTADANLSGSQPPKKERSLPWWDDTRYYIHGKIALCFTETKWNLLATTDPYEKLDKLEIISGYMEIQQTDGRVYLSTKDFKAFLSSMESLLKQSTSKFPFCVSGPFLESPAFSVEVLMDWECESGSPLNHYLHALPNEGEPRKKVYDPFRSTSLSLRWSFSLRPTFPTCEQHAPSASMGDNAALEGSIYFSSQKLENTSMHSPTVYLGAHDLVWLMKWWNMNYLPPHKLRSFSRWPRFGVPRAARSGNLSLDRVMTEFFLRLDCTPTCIQYMPLNDDPSRGLTFEVAKLKFDLCYSRGKQQYTFDCKRYPLDLVYRGLDLHLLKAYLKTNNATSVVQDVQTTKRSSETVSTDKFSHEKCNYMSGCTDKHQDDDFLLHSDYFTIRKQTPKADPTRLLAWQEDGERHIEMTYKRSEFENGSDSDQTRSDPSDDDGFNVVIADNCQRVFVYGLKLLWTIENRDAILFFVRGISNAFEPPKPSPSRQYAQRKLFDGQQTIDSSEMPDDDALKSSPSRLHGSSSTSPQHVGTLGSLSSHSPTKLDCSSSTAIVSHYEVGDSEEEGTRHFMVNFIQPQFNLHSEEANGRFLLAAASGRILARSFHSVLHVGYEMIEQAHGTSCVPFTETQPEMAWNRVELSVMLEHVQAHVAPTDVDPGAGLQWLPKILRSSPKVKRTGALLERVFMPCQMYFRYTRHKGGTPELKVKPLKELSFNSPNITATMTSRQFQVMLDVLNNLLFARLPKPRKSILSYPSDDDDYIEEEVDEVVPDGVEEVELAKIDLEERERERKLLLDDIKAISIINDVSGDSCLSQGSEDELWMITGEKSILVQGLKKELANILNYRKAASSALRMALRKAAQLRLMEKEKNKSPSYAMRVSIRINKVVWSMLEDGKSFVEAEINDMIYDFDRDYKDIGVAQFTIKSFDLRNCLPNAKSDMLLSAWNPPPEWGKTVMLRVNSKQGTPKDGNSPLDLFRVEIYPLKIHLTETMYRMMWDYFFPGEDQDSQRRQEVWKVSTTSGSRRVKKSISGPEATTSSSHPARESDAAEKLCTTTAASVTVGVSADGDSYQIPKLQNIKASIGCGSTLELRRSSSFDRTWEENVAESVANDLVLQVHSSGISSLKSGPLNSMSELKHATNEETSRNKPQDSKQARSGRLSQEEKKAGKSHDEKRGTRSQKMMEFHNIKISQVELLLTYEGSRFAVSDLRLLMDTFHRDDFTGTWTRLFSRVKKHIIWGVLKSVTGMQGKKFKAKSQSNQRDGHAGGAVPERDLNFSDSDGDQSGKPDQFPISWPKRPSDGAGDGFVTSIRGLFNSQRRRAKAFVLRTMRGEADNEFEGEWSESDAEFTPFARQLTITKAKKLIRRHTNKFRQRNRKTAGEEVALQEQRSHQSSPRGTTPFQSDSSDDDASSSCEQLNE